jgi:hypothetical protein
MTAQETPRSRKASLLVDANFERAKRRFLVEELERRIRELELRDGREFGTFGGVDWFLCVVFFAVLPTVAILWAG